MSRLVRLYPRSWRDRYEAEFVDLLEQRPVSPGAAVDVVRGALDAHLHPQTDAPMPWTHRLPGLAVLATGLVWIAGLAVVAAGGDAGSFLGFCLMTMVLALPGDYLAPHGRRIGISLLVLALVIVVANLVPWEIASVIAVGIFIIVPAGALTIAAIRADLGVSARWLLLVVTIAAPLVVATAVAARGVVGEASGVLAALLLPYGIAWALLGVRLVVRGSPTIIDPPLARPHPAVQQEISP